MVVFQPSWGICLAEQKYLLVTLACKFSLTVHIFIEFGEVKFGTA